MLHTVSFQLYNFLEEGKTMEMVKNISGCQGFREKEGEVSKWNTGHLTDGGFILHNTTMVGIGHCAFVKSYRTV